MRAPWNVNSVVFENRADAGRVLASLLHEFDGRKDVVVLALPRGGVPVGFEVAQAIRAPFDVFVVRKLGVPGQEELAMGAVASGGTVLLNQHVIESLAIRDATIDTVLLRELRELERRELEYREGRPAIDVRGRTVILVDDGLATGSSMRVAASAVKKQNPAAVVVAVPVASASACAELESEVNRVICASTPEPFWAVGQWYRDFSQISDEEVRRLLHRATEVHSPQV